MISGVSAPRSCRTEDHGAGTAGTDRLGDDQRLSFGGVRRGRRSAAAPKSRADLSCEGSHENAWVIVPAGAAASIIS